MLLKPLKNSEKGFIIFPGLEGLAIIAGTVASVVLLTLNSARLKSRDAKRLADIRQIASGLELYYNDFTRYPNELSQLIPNYLGIIPNPPQPNDGTCTAEENQYTYKKASPNTYNLTFCLGQTTNGYANGVRTLTEKGIK
jgi:type II secretory pathway pseudopilin PulG